MTRHLILFCILFCFLPSAHAGKVVKIKGKKIYVVFDQSEEGTFAEGDLFNLTDADGKKKAIIQLKKIKGFKAIGVLKKGKADKGFATLFRSPGKKPKGQFAEDSSSEESESSTNSGSFNTKKSRWGGMFGYGQAAQDVDQGASVAAQTGSSMAVKGVYDHAVFDSIALRMMGGLEMFSVTGTGIPTSGGAPTSVGTDITYITLDALLKWSAIQTKSMNFYFLGGVGILYPMSKSSDVIVEDTIEQLAVGEFGLGTEFQWGSMVIPIDLTYFYFPSGEDVETSLFSIKFGILF